MAGLELYRSSAHALCHEALEIGVDRAILVPSSYAINGYDVARSAVEEYPGRFAIVDLLAVDTPRTAATLDRWRSRKGVVGARVVFRPDRQHQILGRDAIAERAIDAHLERL